MPSRSLFVTGNFTGVSCCWMTISQDHRLAENALWWHTCCVPGSQGPCICTSPAVLQMPSLRTVGRFSSRMVSGPIRCFVRRCQQLLLRRSRASKIARSCRPRSAGVLTK